LKNINAALDSELAVSINTRLKGKLAIVGIGNIIRGDDGLGPKLIEVLRSRGFSGAALFDCGTAPENYIFPILSTSCDTVVLVDAADIGKEPGAAAVFDLDKISRISFSTHNPSPRLFTDLLKTGKEDINIFVISVQPKSTALGAAMSEEILVSLGALADIITNCKPQ
jgi:hydrogenase 3 maturation protease